MRSKKWLGLAVLIAAMVLAINAFAFKDAAVTNGFSLTVDTTDKAALAIAPATSPDSGANATITGGKLTLAITEKVQPDSNYTFNPVLKITNNTTNSITLSAAFNPALPAGVTATLLRANGNPLGSLPAGQSIDCELVVAVASSYTVSAATPLTGSLVISATNP